MFVASQSEPYFTLFNSWPLTAEEKWLSLHSDTKSMMTKHNINSLDQTIYIFQLFSCEVQKLNNSSYLAPLQQQEMLKTGGLKVDWLSHQSLI